MRPVGVAYGPADNGSVATYAVLDQLGPDTFRVARVAVTPQGRQPGMREVRRMPATGTLTRVMRHAPGALETVMIHPWTDVRRSTPWPKRKPMVTFTDVRAEPVPAGCTHGCLVERAYPRAHASS